MQVLLGASPPFGRERCQSIGIKDTMLQETVNYLRDIAQACTRLARVCPHLPTVHGLEEVAVDLMAKAKELDEFSKLGEGHGKDDYKGESS